MKYRLYEWRPIYSNPAPQNLAIRIYDPEIQDDDFNPTGTAEAVLVLTDPDDKEEWIAALWDPCYDVWTTQEVHPTHWMPLMEPPK